MRLGTTVVSVGKSNLTKDAMGNPRKDAVFRILVSNETGAEEMLDGFTHVVDATGTYGNHNWVGRGGLPAIGE